LETVKGETEKQMISDTPPLHFPHTNTDMEVREYISKKDNPEIIKSYALELMDKYKNNFKIFSDGSKTETGQVGSVYYIPEIKMEKLGITDQSSVFTAELIAIEEALKWLLSKKITEPVVIFTDSLSSVEAIQSQTSNSKPNLIIGIVKLLRSLYLENCLVTFV